MVIAIIVLYTIFKRQKPIEIEQECTCGKFEKCISTITIHKNRMSRDPNEMYRCGKVQRQLEEFKKIDIE
jgi:hypothetical protein